MNKYFILFSPLKYIENEFSIITFSIAMKYLHFYQRPVLTESKWKKAVDRDWEWKVDPDYNILS